MSIQEAAKPEVSRSEEELRLSKWMSEAQQGNSESYRKLLFELNQMLVRFVTHALYRSNPKGYSFSPSDIAQEVLLAIHAKRHTYDSSRRILPWVFAITRHKLIDFQRKAFSETKLLDFDFVIEEAAAPESTSTAYVSTDGIPSAGLLNLLAKLKPKQREAVELTKIRGLTVAEAAKKMAISESNVKVLTFRGIRVLRELLESQNEE